MYATFFGLYLGHLQAFQHKNIYKKYSQCNRWPKYCLLYQPGRHFSLRCLNRLLLGSSWGGIFMNVEADAISNKSENCTYFWALHVGNFQYESKFSLFHFPFHFRTCSILLVYSKPKRILWWNRFAKHSSESLAETAPVFIIVNIFCAVGPTWISAVCFLWHSCQCMGLCFIVEAVHIGNQLCQYGYFFPVNDSKNLVVKDDNTLYRFQVSLIVTWYVLVDINRSFTLTRKMLLGKW
jgi:hypothetical protein